MNSLPTLSAATLGLVLAASQGHANTTVVTRCNVNTDGTFVPALILQVNGQRQVIQPGQSGLTRRILFNEQLALNFAQQIIGSDAGQLVYVDCGTLAQGGNAGPITVPVVTAVPPPPPPPDDDVDDLPGDDSSPGGGSDYPEMG